VLSALISEGRVRRAYLGVAGGSRSLPPRAAAAIGRTRGVEVTSVVASSPAAIAGLRPEDIIVAVEGSPVSTIGDLQRLLSSDTIGRSIAITVVTIGDLRDLAVSPTELV
jgi:S1-C subfamily serine protease